MIDRIRLTIDKTFKNDSTKMTEAITKDPEMIKHASDELLKNVDFVNTHSDKILRFISQRFYSIWIASYKENSKIKLPICLKSFGFFLELIKSDVPTDTIDLEAVSDEYQKQRLISYMKTIKNHNYDKTKFTTTDVRTE